MKTFQKQDSGEGIIQLLENFTLKSSKEARDWLKLHVLITCFCAEKYNRKYDQGYQTRKKEKDRTNEIVKQINAIRKFIKLVKNDPHSSINFITACSNLNKPKKKYPKNERPGKVTLKVPKDRRDTIFQEVLENYETQLNRKLKASEEGFKRMSFTYGGLAVSQTKSTQIGKVFIITGDGQTIRIQGIQRNSFFFHMTYIFRHYTANKLNLGDGLCRMPDIGQPRYIWTEQIFAHLFPDESVDRMSIGKMVNHLVSADAMIHPWHIPFPPKDAVNL